MSDNKDINNDKSIEDRSIEDKSNEENKNNQKINLVTKVQQDITSDVVEKINPTNIFDDSKKEETTLDKNQEINPMNQIPQNIPVKAKPIKEVPVEKKPFQEFVNEHLIPQIRAEFEKLGKSVSDIKLENNIRPIAGDKCWFIYCSIKDTCNFWLSFDKEDISSLKSFSLCRFNEKPSVLESFLIDEKRITLKLITSRILQRLNGQKLLGVN